MGDMSGTVSTNRRMKDRCNYSLFPLHKQVELKGNQELQTQTAECSFNVSSP